MTPREKNLLKMLSAVLALTAILFGATKYKQNVNELRAERDRMAAMVVNYKASPGLDSVLREDKQWIAENEPAAMVYGEAESNLVEFVKQTTEDFNLKLVSPKSQKVENDGTIYRRLQYTGRVIGNQQNLVKWLVKAHSPGDYRSVLSLKLIKSKTEGDIECEVVIEQKVVEAEL